ncbi:hypothetical protein [Streptomyces yaizuensis]|uniref:Integral membrane protein n=1 Tax=Streptomyces yaizuensis TaxID=2989713 RepID=A0ABQ5P2M4_9ACTN|nr:hypothetical protein [Streptomyces sp. YSPA8]GLF96854.1 hypothetical protein SYYSPA8_21175 [Streptomyces sp. YSPA8]
MNDRLLRLYPSAYRASYGQEIADTHRELTAGAPRAVRLRADADLAAHALRVRFGLDAAAPAGRLFALAAPLALAVGAVVCGLRLARWYITLIISPTPAPIALTTMEPRDVLGLLLALCVCVGAVTALTGRWAVGAALAAAGLLGTAWQEAATMPVVGSPLAPVAALLTALVVLACPPELRPGRGLSATAGAVAGIGWFPVVAVDADALPVSTDYGAWPVLVLAAAGAVVAVRERSRGLREFGAVAVASPLLFAHAFIGAGDDSGLIMALVLILPVAAVLTAGVHAVRHRG